jgi:NSS family neurotransmitter:Na+ symporter
MTTARWSSGLGFVLATVGAAVGLGNIWRFSAVVGQNGGAAYLVPYLLAAAGCAVPLLALELAFTTLPTAFATMPFGRLVAVAFFGLLFFAALSSSVALLEVGVAAAANTTLLSRPWATLLLTAGVFAAGLPSALSYSRLDLAVAGRPVLDLVDDSVGTFALPVSALCLVVTFAWVADLVPVRAELGRLFPVVRYLTPTVLVVVSAAQAAGVVRPAWRLLVGRTGTDALGPLVAAALLLGFAALGWWLREWLPPPGTRKERR